MEKRLINAIIRQIGDKSWLEDVYKHGADAGYPGFTYYADTCKFYAAYKKDINALAEEMAEDLGEDVLTMVKGFRCLNDGFSNVEIAKTMYGRRTKKEKNDLCQIDNSLAWFALEEVAREIFDH